MIWGDQWICGCGTHNLFLRKKCRDCGLSRPDAAEIETAAKLMSRPLEALVSTKDRVVEELMTTHERRVTELLAANNAELGRRREAEATRDKYARALRNAARNDATHYDHHQKRRWDGKKPSEAQEPGTIWLTPREIARNVLGERDLATCGDKGEP